MYDADLIERLDQSHSDLIKVCRAAFTIIMKNELLDGMDGLLMMAEVEPGFAEKAEDVEREMSFSRIRSI